MPSGYWALGARGGVLASTGRVLVVSVVLAAVGGAGVAFGGAPMGGPGGGGRARGLVGGPFHLVRSAWRGPAGAPQGAQGQGPGHGAGQGALDRDRRRPPP